MSTESTLVYKDHSTNHIVWRSGQVLSVYKYNCTNFTQLEKNVFINKCSLKQAVFSMGQRMNVGG